MFEPLREWTVFPCKSSVCYFFFLSSLWRVKRIPRNFSIQALLSWSPVLIALTPFTLQQTLASQPCSCLQASYHHNILLPGSLISSSDFATPTHSSPGSPPMLHPRWELKNSIRTSKIIVLLLKPYFQTTNQAVFSLQWLLFYFCKNSKLLSMLWSFFQGRALVCLSSFIFHHAISSTQILHPQLHTHYLLKLLYRNMLFPISVFFHGEVLCLEIWFWWTPRSILRSLPRHFY